MFAVGGEVFPEGLQKPYLPSGSFFSCSSDNTIRLWNTERNANLYLGKNIYSNVTMDLHKVIYVDNNIEYLKDTSGITEKSDSRDTKSGIRVLKIRPDGQHLASGDRTGNIRIYDLGIFDELLTIEAHDGEVLCLEYSKPATGVTLLASASRDRLIHVLNAEKDYILEQTLDDHSSSITSVKFAGDGEEIIMISCGADKSIYFRPAQMLSDGIHFSRLHHTVEKTTMYDMDVDVSQKTVAVACQDKNVRLYSVASGKQEKIVKSSPGGGSLLKVQIDPSGTFFTTSCSSKNISFFDLLSGECVAEVYGHSDLVTDMKFTNDCKRLITVSGDSCVFIWKLDPAMTTCMKQRLREMGIFGDQKTTSYDECLNSRRETYTADYLEESAQDEIFMDNSCETEDSSTQTPSKETDETDASFLKTNGKMPLWVRKLDKDEDALLNQNKMNSYQPRGRWAQSDSNIIIMQSLDTEDKSFCCTPDQGESSHSFLRDNTDFVFAEPQNFQHLLESEEGNVHSLANGTFMQDLSDEDSDVKTQSIDSNGGIFYPSSLQLSMQEESDFAIEEHQIFSDTFDMSDAKTIQDFLPGCHHDKDEDSLTSETCSEADVDENDLPGTSQPQTPEEEKFLLKHYDTLTDDFSEGERFDNSLKDLQPPDDDDHDFYLNPRLSFSAQFLTRFQKTSRPENSDLLPEQQEKNDSQTLENDEQIINLKTSSEKPTEDKLLDRSEKNKNVKSTDFSNSCNLQKLQNDKAASRSSFPGCVSSKNGAFNKSKKGRSYMDATTSSKAKIFRSVSMGDNLNTTHTEGQKKFSNLSRPASSNDLLSLDQINCYNAEDNLCEPALIPITNKPVDVDASPDKLLMPPPPPSCVVIPRLKRKAQSASNLAKPLGKEDQNDGARKNKSTESRRSGVENSTKTKNAFRRSSLTTSKTANMADSSRRASVAELPTHKNEFQEVEDCKNESHVVAVVASNEMSTLSPMPFASNHENYGAKVLLGKCEAVIENLCSAFHKTLELYSEVRFSGIEDIAEATRNGPLPAAQLFCAK
ncbi:hypothetical protein XELAEV_18039250mg [Xenopus laevis]|uniref:MABP1/WDR62 second WD40 domain-containing protein n=1 Tax=Xenopus laevis TaxID=8355 RepID=A0A974H7N3_XENLA|nr:hypothetical protein XELAEV_18039250mg [Xenopus laevis]